MHNDWLETRITFGWLGSALIALAAGLALLRWLAPGGIQAEGAFIVSCWLAVAGILTYARWDFPFQIYSVVFVYLVVCAIMVSVTRKAV